MNNLALFIHKLEDDGLLTFDILGDSDEHFNNRLRIQKYVYLAKYFDIDLGYDYSIYLHGPYSSTLANDYYNIAKDNILNQITNTTNNPYERRGNDVFFNFVKNRDVDWLEAATTLLSLKKRFNDKSCLLERTINMKDHISEDKINIVLEELENNYLNSFNNA